MRDVILLLLFAALSQISYGYVYVVGPNVIRFNHDETVLIGVFEEQNLAVQVWLEHNGNKFALIDNVIITNEATPQTRTVRVTEGNLFREDTEEKPRSVLLVVQSSHGRQETEILLSYKTGYLIVQTNKPIYTPRQRVKVRTFPLDESMRPALTWNVSMDLVSPSNIIMDRRRKTDQEKFFKFSFELPPNPDIGIWTIKAYYNGQFETQARATFEVQEYALPRFGVDIAVNTPYILKAEKNNDFVVTVTAEYLYKEKVQGTGGLRLYLNIPDGDRQQIMKMHRMALDNGVAEFSVEGAKMFESPVLVDKPFPTGAYLECEADVFESATGKEEFGRHTNTIFAAEKYKFDYHRSKKTYHPGMNYHLRFKLFFANGEPAQNEKVTIVARTQTERKLNETTPTDVNGYVLVLINTAQKDASNIVIKVTAQNGENREFTVLPYQGHNQIQVEHVINRGDTEMRAFTNIQGDGYTGLVFVVVSRGRIVHSTYERAGTQVAEPLSESLQTKISPSARLLVFYVDKDKGKVVADAVKFSVNPVCQKKELSLDIPSQGVNIPGGSKVMTITGVPGMTVGLNVMDKALLHLNSENILRRSKMFQEMESHDLGCGESGGRTSEEIFKNAGLTLVASGTDFRLNKRENSDCEGPGGRRKRSTGCLAHPMCCEQGYEYADRILDQVEDGEKPDPWTTCYAHSRKLAKESKLPTKCIMEFLKECNRVLSELYDDEAEGRSLGSGSDYIEDLKLSGINNNLVVRKDFRESWLFEKVILNQDGVAKKRLVYPDSITEWMVQGVGVSEDSGLCIAEPANVTVFKDFFIQLDLPYKAVRMEHLDVKATIFNYGHQGDKEKDVSFYLEGTDNICSNVKPGKQSRRQTIKIGPNSAETVRFPIIPLKAGIFKIRVSAIVTNIQVSTYDAVEKELFVVNEGVEVKENIQVCLDPLEQMEDCQNHWRIDSGTQGGAQNIAVDLLLPKNSIPTTGMATAYLSTNLMAEVVETLMDDVENLFQYPAGCGEQTIIRLAPTVYAMAYLKRTKQVTPDIETKGNDWIRYGVSREKTYRHPDGSYAAWLHRPSSTWLTAFVAKVFCQAKDVVDDAVAVAQDIVPTVQWFANKVNGDGSFYDSQPVIHREMIGHLQENDPSLTAFVMISMSECKSRIKGLDQVFMKAMRYVEGLPLATLKTNPYLAAISAYALALADSQKKWDFKQLLDEIGQTDNNNGMYWGSKGGAQQANSASIEITSYALLTFMLFDDFRTSAKIVSWLTAQRDARGIFRTTQDTVIGLQALSTYSARTYTRDVDLEVTMVANDWEQRRIRLTTEQSEVRKVVKNLPVEKDNSLSITVTGKGTGRIMIDLRYNRNKTVDEVCPFKVSPIELGDINPGMENVDVILDGNRKCDVCGFCEEDLPPDEVDYDDMGEFDLEEEDVNATTNFGGAVFRVEEDFDMGFGRKKRQAESGGKVNKQTCIRYSVKSNSSKKYGMSIVNFGLETGMSVVESDLNKMVTDGIIARYEMPVHGKGYVIFYLNEITTSETPFVFRLQDNFEGDVDSRQAATVSVYDYYHPEKKCTEYYGTGGNSAEKPVEYDKCDDEKYKQNCKCVQTICARAWKDKILDLAKTKSNKIAPPAVQLAKRTCDMEKADYAVFVQIEKVDFNGETLQKFATGKVIRRIHQGAETLKKNSEMTFTWKGSCTQPNLEVGKKYYIIAKDGPKTRNENGVEYTYPLMDTAFVLERPKGSFKHGTNKKILQIVMKNYEKWMKSNKCQL